MSLAFCPQVLQPQMGLTCQLSLFTVSSLSCVQWLWNRNVAGYLLPPKKLIINRMMTHAVTLKTVDTSQQVIGLYSVVKWHEIHCVRYSYTMQLGLHVQKILLLYSIYKYKLILKNWSSLHQCINSRWCNSFWLKQVIPPNVIQE